MAAIDKLITENIDIWTSAVKRKSSAGRGGSKKIELYGVKKLRELILDLAVRGLLVPQDPNDEPASVLLERIATEKAELEKSKKIKKQKLLTASIEETKPFRLPAGWAWCRLDDLALTSNAGWSPKCDPQPRVENSWGVLKVSAVSWGKFNPAENKALPAHLTPRPELEVKPGDFLISRANTADLVAKAVIVPHSVPSSLMMSDKIIRFVVSSKTNPYFLTKANDSVFARKYYSTVAGGTSSSMKNVTREQIRCLLLALPPEPEQHRIVAKVDELMALCDQLEQQTESSLTAHQTLVQTLLSALTQAAATQPNDRHCPTDASTPFTQAWNRLAEHFDTVFTTEDSIEQLKQTILQLAVMGKLVPQDPNDEPASELLKRIAAEKAELVKAKKIKKQKALPEIGEEEKPFGLPDGWVWAQLNDLVSIAGGKRVANGYKLLTNPTPYTYIRVSDMQNGTICSSDLRYIDKSMHDKISNYIITDKDIYMTIVGATIGKCGFIPKQLSGMNLTENAARITPHVTSKYFLLKALSSEFCQNQFSDKTKQVGVQKMALNRLAATLVPLPPLSEQTKIVNKIEEFMTYCDKIKHALNDAQSTRIQLTDSVSTQIELKTLPT